MKSIRYEVLDKAYAAAINRTEGTDQYMRILTLELANFLLGPYWEAKRDMEDELSKTELERM